MLEHMMANTIDNTILLVSRDCAADFKHIGMRRMEHSVKACVEALNGSAD